MHEVNVHLGERSYPIYIGSRLLLQVERYVIPHLNALQVIIVTDAAVAEAGYAKQLEHALQQQGIGAAVVTLPAGESTKSFTQLAWLMDQLLTHRPERGTTLMALGGGVVGDMTGFAASILLRGVPFIQVPTTILAMVDSSVGGKTGINMPQGKNLVGSFYQPQAVVADIDLLATLPTREWQAGYAEIVKYGLLGRADFFAQLVEQEEATLRLIQQQGSAEDMAWLAECIRVSCEEKARIVAEDEREGGVRALLNLGHTFGHAIEAEMGYDGRVLHGEAVAIGMVMAAAFSAKRGLCDKAVEATLKAHLQAIGLPVHPAEIGTFDAARLLDHMRQDKKVREGKLVFILLRGIGSAMMDHAVPEEEMLRFLTDYLSA